MDNYSDNVCEPPRVTVQSIRERFEIQQRQQTPLMTRNVVEQPEISSEADWNHSGSSNASESDHSSTGGFQQHNRTSIKRSPAFRTGHKSTEVILDAKKTGLKRQKDPNTIVVINNHKKPSLRRKPGVDRTSKPNLSPEPNLVVDNLDLENDPLIEEALKAPLPAGPAPKKPPRTFLHDAFIQQQMEQQPNNGTSDEPDCSPQRPARRNKAGQQSPVKPQRPTSIALGAPFSMSRSKTEPFLLGRPKSVESTKEPAAVEDLRHSPLDDAEFLKESRWLNPVQWNSFSPAPIVTKSPLKKQTIPRLVSSSMLTIVDPTSLQVDRNGSHPAKSLSGRHPLAEPRRMSCDFDGGRRRPSNLEFTWQSTTTTTGLLGFHGRKEPPVSLGHVYDQPTLEGGLHYMVRHS